MDIILRESAQKAAAPAAPCAQIEHPLQIVALPPPGAPSPDYWETYADKSVFVDALSFHSVREALRDAGNAEDEEEQYEEWVEPPQEESETDESFYDDDDSGPDEEPYGYYFGDDEL